MKKILLIILGIVLSIESYSQCTGVSAIKPIVAGELKSCSLTVVGTSNQNIVVADSITATIEIVPTLSGSTSSGGNLQLQSTTNATKGKILFGSGAAYDGVSGFIGIGTQSPSGLLNLSGNFTTSAWTTNGVRLRAASQTFTDNSSSGNVANVYMDVFGTTTYAASSAVTVTGNLIGVFYMVPAAGANVTAPNLFSLGTQGNILSGGSIQLNNGGTNTGFTIPNATNFRIQTGGSNTERLKIVGSTGQIGIGTTAPTPTSDLTLAGSLGLPYVAKTTTYTVGASDYTIDCTSGTFNVTLPTAVSITGRVYVISNTGAGTITLATTSSQTINGSTTQTILAGGGYSVQSNGANWTCVGKW